MTHDSSGAAYQENPRVEGGQVEEVVVTTPAAGVGWTYTIPAGYTMDVRSIAMQLVTDGNVASRTNFQIVVDDGTTELGRTFAATTCAASKTFQMCAHVGFEGGGGGINDVCTTMALPVGAGTRLLPGWRIKALAPLNVQAGDQFSNIVISAVLRPYPN